MFSVTSGADFETLVPFHRQPRHLATDPKYANQSHDWFLNLISNMDLHLRSNKHTYSKKNTASYAKELFEFQY